MNNDYVLFGWLFIVIVTSLSVLLVPKFQQLIEIIRKNDFIKEIRSNRERLLTSEKYNSLTIPNGKEFDKYFLYVMKKSEGSHRLNDRDRKVMRMLCEQDEFEIMREQTRYIRPY